MLLTRETFLCVDCETTGLDVDKDRIIEVAAIRFTLETSLDEYQTLVDPQCPIPEESQKIHNISEKMVAGQPTIDQILPELLAFIGETRIVGHGVGFDLQLIDNAAKRAGLESNLATRPYIDTLRLARLYGDSPNNSLGQLARHFNIAADGAHRAMTDVQMNIEVFKHLVRRFKTTKELFDTLAKPIRMKYMPLGKHKGRAFSDIPLAYLQWAANMDFDQDLLYSIRSELKRRKQQPSFKQSTNPFSQL